MSVTINIVPSSISYEISKVEITGVNIILYKTAMININLIDKNGIIVKGTTLTMDVTDYNKWTNQDNYLEDWVLKNLGFIRASEGISSWILG